MQIFSDLRLPSNRKFGIFFSIIFFIASIYFLNNDFKSMALISLAIGFLFLITALFKAELLLPYNKIWAKFGYALGIIVSPFILGIIFFGLFTPIAFGMRLFGRDELGLRFKYRLSYWKLNKPTQHLPITFRNQF